MTMTGRERIRITLNHEEPDRVPVDFGGSRVTGIAAVAYKKLLDSLHIDETIRIYDIKQQLADPSIDMIIRMGGDVVQISRLGPTTGMPFLRTDIWTEGILTDETPCLVPEGYDLEILRDGTAAVMKDGNVFATRPEGALYFDVNARPLAHVSSPEDIDRWTFPDLWSDREEEYLKRRVDELYHGTDLSLFAGLPLMNCSFFEIGHTLFGYETFMMNLLVNLDLMEYWLDAMLAHDFEILERFLAVTGPYIDAIQLNDDYGGQEALQVSPQMYRELFKPRQSKWIEFVRKRTDAKIFIHCDGAISEILDDFVEIGIDILNPLQTNAAGMEPINIKKRYGDRISFWGGGVETQTTLPFGSMSDISREVEKRIRQLGRGGGYVFAPIHNIQPDIPPEKVLAVFETAKRAGVYPL